MLKKLSFTAITLLIILAGLWITIKINYPTVQPPVIVYYYFDHLLHPGAQMKKDIIGFLPYWRLDDIQYIHHDLISEINYFALYSDENGNFIKASSTAEGTGWANLQNDNVNVLAARTQISGGKFSISIAAQRNKIIENLLDSDNARQNLIQNTIGQIKTYHLNAVNIDFEYLGKPDAKYRQEFTAFIKNLSSQIQVDSPETKIYLSVPPLAARDPNLFDFKSLNPLIDKFIVMSYDYYSAGSDIAGPTAPINGFKENKYFFDITSTYEDYAKVLPKNKIIMGIPFYGRDWAVENGSKIQSRTFPAEDPANYSAINTYAYLKTDKDLKPENCQWDEYALQTWCWYTEARTQTDHQVWLEDNKSLNIKFNFAQNHGFPGVAIWALEFDKNYPDLWTLITSKFTK